MKKGTEQYNYRQRLLEKFSNYGLTESDLNEANKTFSEFLINQIEDRDKVIEKLSDALRNGKNITDKEVSETIENYRLLNVS